MIYFVTGIDTNIGKTFATGTLAKKWRNEGRKVITQKFIQTGCINTSEDIEMHRRIMGLPLLEEDENQTTCPVILSYPASPHLAAKIDHCSIDIKKVDEASERLQKIYHYEDILLEGAGGIYVPIAENYTTLDYIKTHHYPLIIVTSGKLGSISQTLSLFDVCRLHQIEIAMVVYNKYPKEDSIIEDNTQSYLQNYVKNHFPSAEFYILEKINLS